MARFYGELRGRAATTATREGSERSGLWAHVRGWDIGVVVFCEVKDGRDVIRIYKTGGSNDPSISQLLAVVEGPAEAEVGDDV